LRTRREDFSLGCQPTRDSLRSPPAPSARWLTCLGGRGVVIVRLDEFRL